MKIGFNFLNSGMANNGGTRTLIKSAQTLDKLGHKTEFISNNDSFTWFPHNHPIPHIPNDLDLIIATACTTVSNTISSSIKNKAWWIRGHEIWAKSEDELVKLYRDKRITKLVNSNWLKKYLTQNEVPEKEVFVVPQGLDFSQWEDRELRKKNQKTRIGCLHSTTHKTKRWGDFKELASILGSEKYEYVAIGAGHPPNSKFLQDSISNPNQNELIDFYSSCDIWFAPTSLEGLHNCPMEAALCGALVVCSNFDFNGMIHDYAFDGRTAHVFNDATHAAELIKNADYNLVGRMKELLVENIGTREYNMRKLLDIFHEG